MRWIQRQNRVAFFLLLSLLSCKKSGVLASKNIPIVGNLLVNFNLVSKDFKVTKQYHPDLVPFQDRFLGLAEKGGYSISDSAIDGLKKIVFVNEFSAGTPYNVAATCTTRVAKSKGLLSSNVQIWKEIQVRTGLARQYGIDSKEFELIIMHELFHCLMNREHYENEPAVMNAVLNLSDKTFIGNLDSKHYPGMFFPSVVDSMPIRPSAGQIKKYNFGVVSKALEKLINQ